MTEARSVKVNGKPRPLEGVPDSERLLDSLRWRWEMRGTKEGCRTGDCGACTVLVNGDSTLSCLALTAEVAGQSVTTIEGLGEDAVAKRVRSAFVEEGAAQCGYCTPGFVMALVGWLRSRRTPPTEAEVRDALQGNLCRCTGYASILRAALRASGKP